MTLTTDDQKFIEAMRASVEERGRLFVYPDEWKTGGALCKYLNADGEPSCLIGMALVKMGINTEVIRKGEGENADTVMRRLNIFSDGLIHAACEAQEEQDSGRSWGLALNKFEALLLDEEGN